MVSSRMLVMWFLGLVLVVTGCNDCEPTQPEGKGEWQFLGLENWNVRTLHSDPPYLYACAGSGGLFRIDLSSSNHEWVNLGLSSSMFPTASSGGVNDLVVLGGDTLLVSSDYYEGSAFHPGLYRSTDGGFSWVRSDTGITYYLYDRVCGITCLAACEHFVFAGTNSCGFFRSGAGGQHWEPLQEEVGIGCTEKWIEISPSECSTVWVAGGCWDGEGIGVSHDHGETWGPGGFGYQRMNTVEIALDPNDPMIAYVGAVDSVVKSEDRGVTFRTIFNYPSIGWTEAMAHTLSSGHLFVAARINYSGPDTATRQFYEIGNGGAYIDTLGAPITVGTNDLLHDIEADRFYAATRQGVYQYDY